MDIIYIIIILRRYKRITSLIPNNMRHERSEFVPREQRTALYKHDQ